MSFRSELLALIAGVAVLPLVFSAFFFYLRGMNAEGATQRLSGRQFLQMMSWIDEKLPEAWRAGNPEAAAATLPERLEVIVVDSERRIILSSLPGFPAGGKYDVGDSKLYQELMEEGRFHAIIKPVIIDGRSVGMVIQRMPARPDRTSLVALRLEGIMAYMGVVVVGATIMILSVTGSLRQGINRLVEATARVAKGDLNFELKPRGKDEIAELTRSFESMRRTLKEELARRSRFLMAVSHDLKTPLTAIKGYLEAVQDGLANDPQVLQSYMSIMDKKTGVLEERITELIDYVKMSTGQWLLRHRPLSLRGFLSELGKTFAADAPVFHRAFSCQIDLPGEVEVRGDERLLTRALDNLFHNALRYTREGDSIRLLARQEGGDYLVLFEDSGPGVAGAELEKIFEPFYRGTESRREAGTGLGLSTVRSILEAHGWSIKAASLPGSGLTFTIRIKGAQAG